MQARIFFQASIVLASILAGCAPAKQSVAPDTHDADVNAIRQLEADWSQSFSTKDIGKATAVYADDASLLIANMPMVTGKDNIANTWKQYMADRNFSLTFSPGKIIVAKSGDLSSTQGRYTMTYTDPKTSKAVLEEGKYVEIYMKEPDGSWKNVADIGNADGPVRPVQKK